MAPFSADQSVGGALVVIHDVTEQRKSEQTRREFIANVSHELRTPLTNVKSYAETILSAGEDLPTELRENFLGVIVSPLSLVGFRWFLAVVEAQPIFQPHGYKPPLPVSPVEHGGSAILKSLSVPHRLGHCRMEVQPLRPLALDVDTGEAGQVRYLTKG